MRVCGGPYLGALSCNKSFHFRCSDKRLSGNYPKPRNESCWNQPLHHHCHCLFREDRFHQKWWFHIGLALISMVLTDIDTRDSCHRASIFCHNGSSDWRRISCRWRGCSKWPAPAPAPPSTGDHTRDRTSWGHGIRHTDPRLSLKLVIYFQRSVRWGFEITISKTINNFMVIRSQYTGHNMPEEDAGHRKALHKLKLFKNLS